MNPQRPQRPVGVLLSALALGLTALFLFLLAFGTLLGAASTQRLGGSPAGMPQSPAFTAAVMGIMVCIYLAFAGWSIATLVGLLRMRPWARISTMVIAGGLAFLGLLSAIAMLGMQSLVAAGNVPLPPNVPPALLHKIIVVMAVVSLLLAAVGIGWLIYLAQRRTREAFALAALQTQAQQPHAWPSPPGYTPGGQQQAPQPNPLTDFTVARPIAPVEPAQPAPEYTQWPQQPQQPQQDQAHPAPWPIIPIPPHTQIRTGRPVSITVLAIFALISAVVSLFGLVSPFPAFLFGFIVSGWPVHLYSLVWAAAAAIAGLGMLRLQRPAWVLAFVLLGISALNALTMLLPAARARYAAYILAAQQNSPFGRPTMPLPAGIMAATAAIGMLFGLLLIAFCAILLWRARWAFEPTISPPASEAPEA